MRHSRFLVGAVGGAVTVAAVGGAITYPLAIRNVQHTTISLSNPTLFTEVDGHPALRGPLLEARIEGWYHPLPWVGRNIHDVSCPTPLKAVVGTTGTCTARADGERVTIPIRVIEVEGDPAGPKVTWRFER
ncbi:DUF4333 domain-containing protein [Streptomyces sp. NPDC002845]